MSFMLKDYINIWLLGIELKIYAMDWIGSGMYRFGKLNKCLLPVDEDDSKILEDAYCILKLLEVNYYIAFLLLLGGYILTIELI